MATLPLVDVVQSAATGQRSCRIHVRGRMCEGELYLQRGEVVHAAFGDLVGNDAAFALLAETDAWFEVEMIAAEAVLPRTVTFAWRQLLMEGVRRQDEGTLRYPTPLSLSVPFQEEAAALEAHLDGTRRRHLLLLGAVGAAAFAASAVISALLLSDDETPPPAPVVVVRDAAAGDTRPPVGHQVDEPPLLLAGDPPPSPMPRSPFTPTIRLRLLIGTGGQVEEVLLPDRRPDLALFEETATSAVRSYRFKPAVRGGQPAPAWIDLPVTFTSARSETAAPRTLKVTGAEIFGGTLSAALTEAFESEHPGVHVAWHTLHSKAGFGALLAGNTDVVVAVRPLGASEINDASTLGLSLSEHLIGHDALVAIVHPGNQVPRLELDALTRLLRGQLRDWRVVGGPRAVVRPLVGRSYTDVRGVMDMLTAPGEGRGRYRSGTRYYEGEEDLVRAVANTPGGIALVSRVLLSDDVRSVPLVVKGAAREPDAPAILQGQYPLRRSLHLYTQRPPSPDASSFVRFMTSPEARTMLDRWGFVTGDVPAATREMDGCPDLPGRKRPKPLRLTFARQATSLVPAARHDLEQLALHLHRTGASVLVIGHSDAKDGAYNAARDAAARARNVVRFIRDEGIPADRIEVRSEGADAPIESNVTKQGRRKNRRVDIHVIEPAR